MKKKPWILGAAIGVAVGLTVAFVMTYLDWRLNPAGIFHSELGTNWDLVLETAVSWFVPVALAASAIAIPVLVWFSSR